MYNEFRKDKLTSEYLSNYMAKETEKIQLEIRMVELAEEYRNTKSITAATELAELFNKLIDMEN